MRLFTGIEGAHCWGVQAVRFSKGKEFFIGNSVSCISLADYCLLVLCPQVAVGHKKVVSGQCCILKTVCVLGRVGIK